MNESWLEFSNIRIRKDKITAFDFHPEARKGGGHTDNILDIYLSGGQIINIEGDEALTFWENIEDFDKS